MPGARVRVPVASTLEVVGMRAIEVPRFGGPEVLVPVEVPEPVPGAGEVVVEVAAADTLWVETMVRSGRGGAVFPVRPPYRPGVGVAGTVTAVGRGVGTHWLGRRVVTRTGPAGGYVERALVPVTGLAVVPDEVDLRDAAAVLHDGVTALALADIVKLARAERVLVTAAGGGLGAILVQLAHAAGATVVAAARGTAKLDRVRELGAEVPVDYSAPDWTDRVRKATGGLDVLLDGAGGDYGRAAFELVERGGRYSAHGTPAGTFGTVDAAVARARGVAVTGIEAVQLGPDQFHAYLEQALAEVAADRIRPLIGQTFPLERAADAHAAIEHRTAIGKTLLLV
ncbi:zinc-binding dehydrogenase [Plantactinospora sp. KLBMP9567]|uniref:zinc-binding dehydrogenase n=1 Tax=Plantactinospora sp. KLBMP9567 TaxID=3085900 RepID=UPI002981101A|nr:zinc-binding dehydrogenase [Plantactinospora sp. KLBMP9567]MDW5330326.1 zinc-binding dehydrogenase [Plantactinospora sp. KLBMP9567]